MERPNKFTFGGKKYYYESTDIDPLLDELERLKAEQGHLKTDKKPFPSYEEFEKWYHNQKSGYVPKIVYDYFAKFQYEKTVYPKVGDVVEGETFNRYKIVGRLTSFYVCSDEALHVNTIRPVTRPTREEVVAKVESKLDNDELTFDRELVEQFLRILRGE